jgi:signal transduction histidine kinase
MDPWQWLSVVLSVGAILAVGWLLVVIARRLSLKTDNAQIDHLSSALSAELDLILRRLDDLERTIPGQLERTIPGQLDALLEARTVHAVANGEPQAILALSDETSEYMIVEGIAHELKTPLAAIKASAAILADMYEEQLGTAISEEIETEVTNVHDDVAQCEEILFVFRHVIADLRWANEEPGLLGRGARRACQAAEKVTGRRTQLELHLPEDVPGFSLQYLAALIRPLIVNAVEASPENGGKVMVKLIDKPDMIELVVENFVDYPVDPNIFLADGSSRKPGHRGLGIRTARILADVRRGRLTHDVHGKLVRVQITLPKENV